MEGVLYKWTNYLSGEFLPVLSLCGTGVVIFSFMYLCKYIYVCIFTVFAGCGSALPLDSTMQGTSSGAALLSLPGVCPGAGARTGRPSPSGVVGWAWG